MRITKIDQANAFLEAADRCEGNVCLKSPYGDVYNLKSKLSQYIAIAALLGEHGDELELYCDNRNDESIFFEFLSNNPEVR